MTEAQSKYPHFWVGFIMVSILMGTALVSPLYPLYGAEWALSTSQIAQIYVYYMVGALTSLLFFGRLPDRWGYRPSMIAAVCIACLGTVLSILADGFYVFCFARFLVGVAGSMITTAGTVALSKVTPPEKRKGVAMLSSIFIALGFSVGPLVGGVMGQWAPQPLITAHLPALFMLLLSVPIFFWCVPTVKQDATLGIKDMIPRLSWSSQRHTLVFGFACCLGFIVFAVFGIFAAVTPMMVKDFTGLNGPIVSGISIGFYLLGVALVQIFARGLPLRMIPVAGLTCLLLSNVCMLLNVELGSLALFILTCCISTTGHGLCMLAGSLVIYQISGPDNRGALTSTFWAVGYSGGIFPLLLVGWISDNWGMPIAVQMFCALMGTLAAIVLTLMVLLRKVLEEEL